MYIEPKSLEVRKLVRICGLMLTPANYNTGQWSEEAAKTPGEIGEFYSPHGDEVSEEQLEEAVKTHIQKHGWRLKPVYVISVFIDNTKRIKSQLSYINERLAFVTSGKAEPWNPEFQ